MTKIIEVSELKRTYGKDVVLNAISFDIKQGEVLGIMGPNGVGKTTLLSVLTTALNPSSGKVRYFKNGAWFDSIKQDKQIRCMIGVVFQEFLLDEDLTIYQNLDVQALIYELNKEKRKKMIIACLNIVDLEKQMHKKVKILSGGLKKRAEIARGILSNPEILYLDEPTLGLDPVASRRVLEYILELNKSMHKTIIISTNNLNEAKFLCNRVLILNEGKIKFLGEVNKLKLNFWQTYSNIINDKRKK